MTAEVVALCRYITTVDLDVGHFEFCAGRAVPDERYCGEHIPFVVRRSDRAASDEGDARE